MRKFIPKVVKIIAVLLAGLSLYLLLLSSATVRVDDTHKMAKEVIDKVLKNSDQPELTDAIKMVRTSGLEDDLIANLNPRIKIDFSYADVYQLSTKYDNNGKLTVKDFPYKPHNSLEEVIEKFLLVQVNKELKKESEQVSHLISIFRYSIFAIVLLYILAAILFIFGRYWASIPLLVGSLTSFGALWLFCNSMTRQLQAEVYSGITIDVNSGIWIGLIIGLVTAIAWPFLLKLTQDKKKEEN
ncbi:hypothetical protein [Lactobacillus kalixensis]|uniref:Uncharacterized protein n=1 Tax=Lactobacillus kalixensis DSM 16043 TaxID=1423763 RepID=A0A0R1UAG5_9LACO|nr:hypothetical protein [Lactobacillus kalixensis]KRL90336.1 hypothetical protein FC46_GL000240 [Lactobacillus kalixensis DSM 16043]